MNPEARAAALFAAMEASPRESCGLVVVVNGKERYWPCRNISACDGDFTIDPADYLAASRAGTIVAVCHSHPDGFPDPSPADRASCEKWGLPWHIVSPHLGDPGQGQWFSFEPSGWRAPLIGRQWTWGIHDCWALVRDWYCEQGLELRDFERPIDPDEFLRQPLFEELYGATGFVAIPREDLRAGDSVLQSRFSPGLNHVGVIQPDGRLLHHVQGRLSSADLYGEGQQRCTGKVLRPLAWMDKSPWS
jgi:hypothetical protein